MSFQAQAQLPQECEPAFFQEPVLWATIDHLRVPEGHYVRIPSEYGHGSLPMARQTPGGFLKGGPTWYLSNTCSKNRKTPLLKSQWATGPGPPRSSEDGDRKGYQRWFTNTLTGLPGPPG